MCDFIKKLFKLVFLGIIVFSMTVLLTACASQNTANIDTGGETKLITDIITSEDAVSTIVTVKGSQKLTYTAIKQVFPLGVLFHFPETGLDNIKNVHYPSENDTITSIKANQIEEDGVTSRIFIALKKDLPYNITPDDNGLHISFPKTSKLIAEKTTQDAQLEEVEGKTAPTPEITEASSATRITSVTATPLKKNVVINVKADGKINSFKSFPMDNPPRIVYDLFNLKSPYSGEQRIAVKSNWVSKIRHFGYPDKIRMVLETKKDYLSKFLASPVDKGLLIYVGTLPASVDNQKSKSTSAQVVSADIPEKMKMSSDQAEQPVAAGTKAPENTKDIEQVIAQASTPAKLEEKEPSSERAAQPAVAESEASEAVKQDLPVEYEKPAWLNRIDFSSEEAGKSAVIIGTTRPVEYQVLKVKGRRLQLKLLETRLPEYRKRALITTRFQSAVDRITPTQQPNTNATIIAFELREAVPYVIKQTENIIKIDFSPSSIPPKPYEDAKLPAWKKVLAEPGAAGEKPISEVAQKSKNTNVAPEAIEELKPDNKKISLEERVLRSTPTEKYTGERIALDFYDTDIKNVFRIIREISGKNFAIDKNVTGKVTLALDKPVPWDQVLDLVLKMNQLGLTMEGDIIRIATLSTLAQEEKLRQEQLKAENIALNQQKALEPLITTYIPINYSDAQSEILPHVQPILTANRGKVSVDKRNNQLIFTDTAEKIEQARQIVKEIDRVTPQVIIEARVVEANSNFVRDLGFDWGTISIGPIFELGDNSLDFTLLASNLPSSAPTAELGFNFTKLKGTPFSILDARLQVSEREGKTNIISSPKIVTLDNKKAKIKQGLEVAFLERDDSGGSTVKFKDVDLLLEVTPNITPDDRISMKVFLTKNEIDDPTVSPPTLATNEAETELLVDDGDTIVIGGIVKSTLSYSERGIPGLRKIGVLGWLFKNQFKQDQKNELLIFITPRIIKLAQKKQRI